MLFGKYSSAIARFVTCDCRKEQGKKSFNSLTEALATLVYPELALLQSRAASLIPTGRSLELLNEILPVKGAISFANMKINSPQIGQRIGAAHVARTTILPPSAVPAAMALVEEGQPSSIVVSVDAGYD